MNDDDDEDDVVTVGERADAASDLMRLLLPDEGGDRAVDGDADPLLRVGSDLARELSDALIRVHDSAVSDLTSSTTTKEEGGEYRTLLERTRRIAGEISRRLERLATAGSSRSVERGKGEGGEGGGRGPWNAFVSDPIRSLSARLVSSAQSAGGRSAAASLPSLAAGGGSSYPELGPIDDGASPRPVPESRGRGRREDGRVCRRPRSPAIVVRRGRGA